MTYSISPAGLDFIKRHEGCVLHTYMDEAGIPTIGYGHARWTGTSPITQAVADILLAEDLRPVQAAVNSLFDVPLTQGQVDALCSFTFNCGTGALTGSSIRQRMNAGDATGAADAFLLWDKVSVNGQLVPSEALANRRAAERAVFLGDTPTAPDLPDA